MTMRAVVAAALLLGAPADLWAQDSSGRPNGPGAEFAAEWPFAVGETTTYDVTFGPVRVGSARLAIEALDSLDAGSSYRLAFELEGGPFFYKIDDRNVSWLGTAPYRSLRFEQILHQGGYERHRRYDLDHDGLTYDRQDWDEDADAYRTHDTERDLEMPQGALDEISLLFLVRTLPLEVGRTYTFENYFQEDGNPVVVEVLRRESVRVRAGRFDTVVIRPIIRTDGLFGEGGRAELYISDDAARRIVQLKTRMKVGEMNMYLREFDAGDP